tara:strand:+ start:382 stop:993 length:612 start_codon:yes stop_codon:yes gene_type:complete
MNISILDYGACNIKSVYYAFKNLGLELKIIKEANDIKNTDKLIIPGVGSAGSSIKYLNSKNLFEIILNFLETGKPILGICLGLQLFSKNLYEDGHSNGFSLLNANVEKISKTKNIFHIGWNKVQMNERIEKFFNIKNNSSFYFCHSYYLNFKDISNYEIAGTNFKVKIPSIVLHRNFMGVQFHPEKSQTNGLKILEKFINWKP